MIGINIDDVLLELSYRTTTGIVDLTDPRQIVELVKILRENGIRNANDIATIAGFNFSMLKEAKADDTEEDELKPQYTKKSIFQGQLKGTHPSYVDKKTGNPINTITPPKTGTTITYQYLDIKIDKNGEVPPLVRLKNLTGIDKEDWNTVTDSVYMTFKGFNKLEQICDFVVLPNLSKSEKPFPKGKGDISKVATMDATLFEGYLAYLLTVAGKNGGNPMTDEDKRMMVDGVLIGDGQELYDLLCKKYRKFLGNYSKLGSKSGCTPFWQKYSTKSSDTPKTDIISSKYNLSVKKGPAQLMSPKSGKKSELAATFFAAEELVGNSQAVQEVKKQITKIRRRCANLETSIRTVSGLGKDALMLVNKYLQPDTDENRKELEDIVSTAEKAVKGTKDPKEKTKLEKKLQSAKNNLVKYDKELKDRYDALLKKLKLTDKKVREDFDKINRECAEIVIAAEDNAKQILDMIKALTKDSPQFKKAMVWESAAGIKKFGKGNKGLATHIIAVSQDAKAVSILPIDSINSEGVEQLLKKTKYELSFKTNSYGKDETKGTKDGYILYQSLRLHVDDLMEKLKETEKEMVSEIKNMRGSILLSEGLLDDFADGIQTAVTAVGKGVSTAIDKSIDFVETMWDKFIKKITSIWNWLLEKVKEFMKWVNEAFDAALELVDQGYDGIQRVLGVEIVVSGDTTIDPESLAK